MSSPKSESVQPLSGDGWCEKGDADGDEAGGQEEQGSVMQVVDVVDKTFHKGRS